MPRRAIQAGIGGVVRAQATIREGAVKEVAILSGPRELHGAVRDAMLQYRCVSDAAEIRAVQEFDFKID
jgi:protein TonB